MEKERRERSSVDEAESLQVEVEVEVERGKRFGRLRLRVVLMEVGDTEIPNGMVRISWTVLFSLSIKNRRFFVSLILGKG